MGRGISFHSGNFRPQERCHLETGFGNLNFMAPRKMIVFAGLIAFTGIPAFIRGQTPTFPSPVASGVLGVKDPSALIEIAAHLQAVSAAAWQDLEGTGTLTYQSGDAHDATLFLSGTRYSRLDVVMGSGTRSLRLIDSYGNFRDEKGTQGVLLPKTAKVGIVVLPEVWLRSATSPQVSIRDRGAYVANGLSLHRITLEYQVYPGQFTSGDPTVATDLYFDSATHLIQFSVDSLLFANSAGQSFLRVTSYGSYQRFSGILFPTALQQTLNGQLQWTLQLNAITVNTNPAESTFSF